MPPASIARVHVLQIPLGVFIEEDKTHYYEAGEVKEIPNVETLPVYSGCYPHVDGTCGVSVTHVGVGQAVTFNAWGSGGSGKYIYNWLGDDEKSGIRKELVTSYSTPGLKRMRVRIFSNGEHVDRNCSVLVVN